MVGGKRDTNSGDKEVLFEHLKHVRIIQSHGRPTLGGPRTKRMNAETFLSIISLSNKTTMERVPIYDLCTTPTCSFMPPVVPEDPFRTLVANQLYVCVFFLWGFANQLLSSLATHCEHKHCYANCSVSSLYVSFCPPSLPGSLFLFWKREHQSG